MPLSNAEIESVRERILYIRRCQRMWNWLAHNPQKIKHEYLEAQHIPEDAQPYASCWLCEYHRLKHGAHKSCGDADSPCLLHSLWPLGCQDGDTPYVRWSNTVARHPHDASAAAMEIVQGCQAEATRLWQYIEDANG